MYLLIRAARYDAPSVRTENSKIDNGFMTQLEELLAGCRIPNSGDPVRACGNQPPAIGAKVGRKYGAGMHQRWCHRLLRRCIPNPCGAVLAGGGNSASVTVENRSHHIGGVDHRLPVAFTGVRVPQL